MDGRSVGELLVDADRITRLLLLQVTGDDARPLARAWPHVPDAAADLWAVIPNPVAESVRDPMARLVATSSGHSRQLRGWPGQGTADGRLLDLAAAFTRAADLIRRHDTHLDLGSTRVVGDIEAARMRIMHSLYLTCHGIGLALRRHVEDLEDHVATRDRIRPDRVPIGARASADRINRFAVIEQVAGAYVGARFAQVAHGEQVPGPRWGGDRLDEALATWDIWSHRVLVGGYTSRDLLETALLQTDIVAATGAFLAAEAHTGQLSGTDYTRLAAALEASRGAWREISDRLGDLRAPGTRTDPRLAIAAGEVRAAARELAFDKTTWAAPELIAARVHLPELHEPLQLALGTATELATALSGILVEDTDLRAPARAIATRFRTDLGAGLIPDRVAAPVSPNAIHVNRLVGIEPVRHQLIDASHHNIEAATRALGAAACLDRRPPPRIPDLPDPWRGRTPPGRPAGRHLTPTPSSPPRTSTARARR